MPKAPMIWIWLLQDCADNQMTKLNRSRTIFFAVLLLALFLSGCSFVRIINVSAAPATVSVNVPDNGKAYVRTVSSGGIVDVFSSHGGGYTITMIPSEQYLEILNRLRSNIETRLFAERQTLTSEEVRQLVENLNHIDSLLEETRLPGASCRGYVPEFDTAVVTISIDFDTNAWILQCESGSGE